MVRAISNRYHLEGTINRTDKQKESDEYENVYPRHCHIRDISFR